jgi:Ferric reductase like transmembrane component
MQGPFLFAFTAQDSLVHSYLGLSFATTRKWHRWLGAWILFDVLLHGALYQVLLVSDGSSLWSRLHRQVAYYHGVSILGGFIAWLSAIVMLFALVPLAVMKSNGWKWVCAHLCIHLHLPACCLYYAPAD